MDISYGLLSKRSETMTLDFNSTVLRKDNGQLFRGLSGSPEALDALPSDIPTGLPFNSDLFRVISAEDLHHEEVIAILPEPSEEKRGPSHKINDFGETYGDPYHINQPTDTENISLYSVVINSHGTFFAAKSLEGDSFVLFKSVGDGYVIPSGTDAFDKLDEAAKNYDRGLLPFRLTNYPLTFIGPPNDPIYSPKYIHTFAPDNGWIIKNSESLHPLMSHII